MLKTKLFFRNVYMRIHIFHSILFQNRVLELEDKKIEMSQKDIMNEIEILAKQIDDNNV